ncbi:hypothetical protein [Breoghania sp.]|uniref:hypothetical protein n=1 Tax=Breoghania sp. TaxID=2065378 RepID=UPI003204E18A
MTDFAVLNSTDSYVLTNATVSTFVTDGIDQISESEDLARIDIRVENAKFTQFATARSLDQGTEPNIDLDGGMVLPTLVDCHTHLDKGHIWPRRPNRDRTFGSTLNATFEDRATSWSGEEVRRHMDFALRCAYAHGTSLIRPHIDSLPPQNEISWPILCEVVQDWSDRI